MNNEQQQIIDEVYDKYTTKYIGYDDAPSKELFLFEIKTNPEFSERWGLKIEERELSHQERSDIKNSPPYDYGKPANGKLIDVRLLDSNNVPTKLITVTYQDKTIDSYEM